MESIGVRELAERASAVVAEVERSGEPALVTRRGRPVAAVVPIDIDDLRDFVLAHAPEFVRGRREAEAELARGVRGVALEEALAELDHDDVAQSQSATQRHARSSRHQRSGAQAPNRRASASRRRRSEP
jgi:prevent-host-death family protein